MWNRPEVLLSRVGGPREATLEEATLRLITTGPDVITVLQRMCLGLGECLVRI